MRQVFLILALLGAAPASADCKLDDLGWLAGTWVYTRGDRVTEESWLAPAGGMLIGVSRTVRAGALREFEFIRIAMEGERIEYRAMPNARAPATVFTLTSCTDDRWVFENPAHDFPTRVIYTRQSPDALLARIEGLRDGKTVGSEWQYQKRKD
jgi:hypothetical protein